MLTSWSLWRCDDSSKSSMMVIVPYFYRLILLLSSYKSFDNFLLQIRQHWSIVFVYIRFDFENLILHMPLNFFSLQSRIIVILLALWLITESVVFIKYSGFGLTTGVMKPVFESNERNRSIWWLIKKLMYTFLMNTLCKNIGSTIYLC